MKKRALMAFPKLTATEEMKQIAASDMPRKEKTKYGYVTEVCDYYVYLRCVVQAGILKAALFFRTTCVWTEIIRSTRCIWIKRIGSLPPMTA